MTKSKSYDHVRFTPEVIRNASEVLDKLANPDGKKQMRLGLSVRVGDEEWEHESEEEFFADYRRSCADATYIRRIGDFEAKLHLHHIQLEFFNRATVYVQATQRPHIEAVFEVFEQNAPLCRLPEVPKPPRPRPVVFIGHGQNPQWRQLKDHLEDMHGYDVVAYEVGARAGHTVRDVLQEMLRKSSIAFLVMTSEDETASGSMRARQNVIHEVGLFQGRLGFNRAIVLLEAGTEEFSNIHGIEQIRFSNGSIRETFGDVLATIKREFRLDEVRKTQSET